MKRCPRCATEKPMDAFGVRRRSPSGRKSWCKACESARQVERQRVRLAAGLCRDCGQGSCTVSAVLCEPCRARRADQRRARRHSGVCSHCGSRPALEGRARCANCLARARTSHIATRTGTTPRDYDALLAFQDGACAICRQPCGTGRHLAVDHDHVSGRVRGLLCFRCNTSLARYEQYAREFAEYLAGANMDSA